MNDKKDLREMAEVVKSINEAFTLITTSASVFKPLSAIETKPLNSALLKSGSNKPTKL